MLRLVGACGGGVEGVEASVEECICKPAKPAEASPTKLTSARIDFRPPPSSSLS